MSEKSGPIGAIVVDGLVQSLVFPHPDGCPLDECFPPGVATPIPDGTTVTEGMTWDGHAFGPAPEPEPVPVRPRMATGYALIAALSEDQAKALAAAKVKDQRLLSARVDPWPEGNPKLARIARAVGIDVAAWFDAALAPPEA